MVNKTTVSARIGRDQYVTWLTAGAHTFCADEPEDNGGKNEGPSPTELVLSGLAACTVSTLRMYADRKGWPMEEARIELGIRVERTDDGQLSLIESELSLVGPLDHAQRERLVEIARKCPIHRMLTHEIRIRTSLAEGG